MAPISPSSAISPRHARKTERVGFESGRVIDRHFCGEGGVPSNYHEAYFSIKISCFAYPGGRFLSAGGPSPLLARRRGVVAPIGCWNVVESGIVSAEGANIPTPLAKKDRDTGSDGHAEGDRSHDAHDLVRVRAESTSHD